MKQVTPTQIKENSEFVSCVGEILKQMVKANPSGLLAFSHCNSVFFFLGRLISPILISLTTCIFRSMLGVDEE